MDGGRRNRCKGDRQSYRKIKQQAKNNREITSKYKAKGTTRQKKKKKKTTGKQKQNKEKQIQTKKTAGGTLGHELAGNR